MLWKIDSSDTFKLNYFWLQGTLSFPMVYGMPCEISIGLFSQSSSLCIHVHFHDKWQMSISLNMRKIQTILQSWTLALWETWWTCVTKVWLVERTATSMGQTAKQCAAQNVSWATENGSIWWQISCFFLRLLQVMPPAAWMPTLVRQAPSVTQQVPARLQQVL